MTASAPLAASRLDPAADELREAVRLYRGSLNAGELFEFDISPLDRLGITLHVASLVDPYRGFANDGFGYGADGREAVVGALGEICETFHNHRALHLRDETERQSYAAMVRRYGSEAVIDPLTLCLPAGSPYAADRPLRWAPVTRWPDGAPCWAPRECVAHDMASYGETAGAMQLFRPITCGLGAGLSPAQAIVHGLLELVQRDGNCTTFRALDRGIDVDLAQVTDAGVVALLAHLREHGLRARAKLAATDFGMANLYVVAESTEDERFPLVTTCCGEAVHPNRDRALRKALLEYVSGRSRKTLMHGPLDVIRDVAPREYDAHVIARADPAREEPRALAEMGRWLQLGGTQLRALLADSVFSSSATVCFSELPTVDDRVVRDAQDRLADVARRLADEGLTVYYHDASPEGIEGPSVVKCVVPGLEGETMSYHRLGERGVRRLIGHGRDFVRIGGRRAGARVRLTQDAEARLGGAAWLDIDAVDAIVGSRYPLYREPASHTAQKAIDGRTGRAR